MALRHEAALQKGTMRAPTPTTLEQAADDWLAAARAGIARTRSGDPYRPSALRSYEQALRTKMLPELGHVRARWGVVSTNPNRCGVGRTVK